MKPLFITFEGVDGCGKTTQIDYIHDYIRDTLSADVSQYHAPGGPTVLHNLRSIIFNNKWNDDARHFLMCAAVSQLSTVISDRLQEGNFVICDRYFDSTYVYAPCDMSKGELTCLVHAVIPDLTFFIDVPPAVIIDRLNRRKELEGNNNMDSIDKEVIIERRKKYLKLASHADNKDRFRIIDGNQYKLKVANDIISEIEKFIRNREGAINA